VCDTEVSDPALAGEVWVEGEPDTRPVADPECLLRNVKAVKADGDKLRTAYIPDAVTGTRWFADRMIWLRDGQDLLPFATRESADEYAAAHKGTAELSWAEAVAAAR
jgi:NitT/TauT family transport system substrate-binding protein